MKIKKKIISILLVMAMLIMNCNSTVTTFAKDVMSQDDISTMTNDFSIEGTNSFGSLLSSQMQEGLEEQEANDGCNVFSIEMSDNVATVSFETTQYATLVVAIYDEAGNTMLASGKTEVLPGETVAYVNIDIDVMPQYYYLRGFLIEESSMRPLCTSYESPNYTKEMQEFLAKTVDDFEEEKVLNLDDDKSTNFAVYSENTIIIPKNETNNNVTQINEENNTYVIENIDDHIRTLKAGDIFAYEYKDGNVLLVKVASISIAGNTATITGEETSLEEVFDYVKIESTSYTQDISVDESTCGEGVTYEGKVQINEEANSDVAVMSGGPMIDEEIGKIIATDFFVKTGPISGDVCFSVEVKTKVYISLSSQYLEFKINHKAKIGISITGKTNLIEKKLCEYVISPVAGVYIKFTPSLVIQASAKLEASIEISGTIGFSVSGQNGIKNLTTTPKIKTKVEGSVTLFIGLSIKPKITIIHDRIADAEMSVMVGGEVKGTLFSFSKDIFSMPEKIHACKACVEGVIIGKVHIEIKAKILNMRKLTFKYSETYSAKITDFYLSLDNLEFGFGSCPNNLYKITFNVSDTEGNAIENASIKLRDTKFSVINKNGTKQKVDELITDSQGRATAYIPGGENYVTIGGYGYLSKSEKLSVNKAPNKNYYLKKMIVKELVLGNGYSGAIAQDKNLYMWGNGNLGQIGSGTHRVKNDIPVKVLDNVVTVSTGDRCTGAITEDGSLYMWGLNSYGQLGNGNNLAQFKPVKVLDNVVTVSLSDECSGIITKNGSLYMCGRNNYGQVGNGTTENQSTPVKVLDNVVTVSFGDGHSGAITKDGSLYMWGSNDIGQVGNGTTENQLTPVKVLDNVVTVSFGDFHSGAITKDGSLYMWGRNNFGQVGNGTTSNYQLTPVKVLDNVVTVSLGRLHSGAITKDGKLYMWGNNNCGQVGNGTTKIQLIPIKVLDDVELLSLEDTWGGAVTKDGSLYMWGQNQFGRVGNGTTENQLTPVKVLDDVELLSLGYIHSGAVTKNGSLYMWGKNGDGQLGKVDDPQLIPIDVLLNQSTKQMDNTQNIEPISMSGVVAYDTRTVSEISFTDLLPNEIYNFYVMKDREAVNAFDSSNLLYLSQAVSDEEGKLSISYQPTEQVDNADIFVVQMKQTDLSVAQVEIENLLHTGEIQYVNPVVTLDGNTLQEGKDYELLEQYSATETGDYTVTVHGIGLYKGEISVSYKVLDIIGDDFTELLQKLTDVSDSTTIYAQIKNTTILPKEALNAIQGKNVTIKLAMNDGCIWSINGNDISSEHLNDINISVIKTGKEEGNISVDVVTSVIGTKDAEQLIFSQNGAFDFTGQLKLGLINGITAEKGVLLQSTNGELKLADSSLISNNTIAFNVNQGADSVIVYGTNGDTNGDDAVTIKDMMQMLHQVSDRNSLNELQKGFADVTMDHVVDIEDVMRVLYYVSGRNSILYEAN